MINSKKIEPIHPGIILKEEFLDALNVSQYRLAKDISNEKQERRGNTKR
jgi:plasmid maintenance system antidote protein VapI